MSGRVRGEVAHGGRTSAKPFASDAATPRAGAIRRSLLGPPARRAGNRTLGILAERGAEGAESRPSLVGGGRPLDPAARGRMEARLGHDFSGVQVHDDFRAGESADALDSRAFTVGHDIFFGPVAPLRHNKPLRGAACWRMNSRIVVQQSHVVDTSRPRLSPSSPLERAADAVADSIGEGFGEVSVEGVSAPGVARAVKNNAPSYGPVSPLVIPKEGIDMPWVGVGKGINSSELGYRRDSDFFWKQYRKRWAQQLSAENIGRIQSGQAPVVDETWVKYHPEHRRLRGSDFGASSFGTGIASSAAPGETPRRLHRVSPAPRQVVRGARRPQFETDQAAARSRKGRLRRSVVMRKRNNNSGE